MAVIFYIIIWPNLPPYDFAHCHLYHFPSGFGIWQVTHSSQGDSVWLGALGVFSYLRTSPLPISVYLQNICTAVCLWVSIQEAPRTLLSLFRYGGEIQQNSIFPNVTVFLHGRKTFHALQNQANSGSTFQPKLTVSGSLYSARHCDHWLSVKVLMG